MTRPGGVDSKELVLHLDLYIAFVAIFDSELVWVIVMYFHAPLSPRRSDVIRIIICFLDNWLRFAVIRLIMLI